MKMLFSLMNAQAKILFVLNIETDMTPSSYLLGVIQDAMTNTHFVTIEDSSGSCHCIPRKLFDECICSVIPNEGDERS